MKASKLKSLAIVMMAGSLLGTAETASAGPIVIDSGWVGFCFAAGAGNPATSGCQNLANSAEGNPFTFTAATDVLFKITDAFIPGDTFNVFDFGNLIISTVAGLGGPTTADPDIAYASSTYGHGSAVLGAGNHEITVFTNATPGGSGGAYLRVDTAAVPEPATLALMGLGLAGMGWKNRRKAAV